MIFTEAYEISRKTGEPITKDGEVAFKVKDKTLFRMAPNGNYWYADGEHVLSFNRDYKLQDGWLTWKDWKAKEKDMIKNEKNILKDVQFYLMSHDNPSHAQKCIDVRTELIARINKSFRRDI